MFPSFNKETHESNEPGIASNASSRDDNPIDYVWLFDIHLIIYSSFDYLEL